MGKSYQGDIALDDITFVNGTCDGKKLNYVPRPRNLTFLQEVKRGEPGNDLENTTFDIAGMKL